MTGKQTIQQRFYSKLDVNHKTGCYDYTGPRLRGYGLFTVCKNGKRRTFRAHRVAWMLHHKRRVPDGLEIDHLCNRKSCCNPDHLEAVSHATNMRRAAKLGVWSGSRNSQAKLADYDVEFIRTVFDGKRFTAEILAELCNVSVRTIYHVLAGVTYAA